MVEFTSICTRVHYTTVIPVTPVTPHSTPESKPQSHQIQNDLPRHRARPLHNILHPLRPRRRRQRLPRALNSHNHHNLIHVLSTPCQLNPLLQRHRRRWKRPLCLRETTASTLPRGRCPPRCRPRYSLRRLLWPRRRGQHLSPQGERCLVLWVQCAKQHELHGQAVGSGHLFGTGVDCALQSEAIIKSAGVF